MRADWEGAEVIRAQERVGGANGGGHGIEGVYEGKDVERAIQTAVAGERQRLLGVIEGDEPEEDERTTEEEEEERRGRARD